MTLNKLKKPFPNWIYNEDQSTPQWLNLGSQIGIGSQMFEFLDMIRKLMYTTNVIESFISQLRKVTKSKRVFTNDQALMKHQFLLQQKICERTGTINGWKQIMAQLIIIFEDRMLVK